MTQRAKVSLKELQEKIEEWDKDENHLPLDPPIDAQFTLDLLFGILIDDRLNYQYLTTTPERVRQANFVKLDLMLRKYSKEYRKWKKEYLKKQDRGSLFKSLSPFAKWRCRTFAAVCMFFSGIKRRNKK